MSATQGLPAAVSREKMCSLDLEKEGVRLGRGCTPGTGHEARRGSRSQKLKPLPLQPAHLSAQTSATESQ